MSEGIPINLAETNIRQIAKSVDKPQYRQSEIQPLYRQVDRAQLKQAVLENQQYRTALAHFYRGDIQKGEMVRRDPEVVDDFLIAYPTAADFAVFATDFVQGRIAAVNPPAKVAEYSAAMNKLGEDFYGDQWRLLQEVMKKPRGGILGVYDRIATNFSRRRSKGEKIKENDIESRAYAQSMQFNLSGRINEQLLPGFFDGGRSSGFIGARFVPANPQREVLVVDERVDTKLATMKARAKEIGEENISESDKLRKVVDLAFNERSFGDTLQEKQLGPQIADKLIVREILLGFFFRGKTEGRKARPYCRHTAKMVHILSKEAGLDSTLVKGFSIGIGEYEKLTKHEWVEVTIDGILHLVDISMHKPNTFTDDAVKKRRFGQRGIFRVVNGQMRDTKYSSAEKNRFEYQSIAKQHLYHS